MKEKQVITDVEQLTPEWLTSIFKNNGYLSQGKVSAIINSNPMKSMSSSVHSLELIFSDDAQTEGLSSKIVIKMPPSNSESFQDRHEVFFFHLVAGSLNERLIPTCYDATISEETGLSHIIFEDLSEKNYELGLSNWPLPPLKRECEKAIDCLAEIHAFWWDHKKLKKFSKKRLKDVSNIRYEGISYYSMVFYFYEENSFNEEVIFKWFNHYNGIWERFLEFLGDRISDNRKKLIRKVFSLYPQLVYERIKKENITIIHNDVSLWNCFFPKDLENEKSKAILTDWQTWTLGVGPTDLAFMFGFYWYPERRTRMEKGLIKRYHTNLVKFGVKNYSWDDCWYDYKLGALLNLYKMVNYWYWGAPPYWWYSLERSILTIEDLNCTELLETK